jgi:hypothetical protein
MNSPSGLPGLESLIVVTTTLRRLLADSVPALARPLVTAAVASLVHGRSAVSRAFAPVSATASHGLDRESSWTAEVAGADIRPASARRVQVRVKRNTGRGGPMDRDGMAPMSAARGDDLPDKMGKAVFPLRLIVVIHDTLYDYNSLISLSTPAEIDGNGWSVLV